MAVSVNASVQRAISELGVTNPITDTLTVTTGDVFIAVEWETAATTVSAVTVNGTAASYITNSEAANAANKVRWYSVTGIPAGSRTVSVTMSGTGGCSFAAFDVAGWDGSTITANILATASATTAVTASSIGVTAGQLLLAGVSQGDTPFTITWTNATEAGDVTGESMTATTAYHPVVSTSASYSVTCTASGTMNRHALSVILLTPGFQISVDDTTIDPHPDTTIVITKSAAWNGAVTATLGGGSITLTAIDTTTKSFNIDVVDFLPGGSLNAVRWDTNITLSVTDSDGTAETTVKVLPDVTTAEDFTQTSGASDVDDYNPITGAVGGDDFFAYWHNGDGVRDTDLFGTAEAGSGYMIPISLPSQGRRMAYDVSEGEWLAHVDTDYFSMPSVGGVIKGLVSSPVRAIAYNLPQGISS